MKNIKKILIGIALCAMVMNSVQAATTVPGFQLQKWDQDANGIPDAGVSVTGHYTSFYVYDASGAYYWDLGDGRVYTSSGITAVADLDQTTLSRYDYIVNYRGKFENDPFMNSGWIQNIVQASGYDYPNGGEFITFIVHKSDPRYVGDPAFAIWGEWEIFGDIISGEGIAHPQRHVTN